MEWRLECELAAYPGEREMISNCIPYLVAQLCSYKIFGQVSACPRAIYPRSLLFLKFVDSAAELQSCAKPTRNTDNSVDHQWKHTLISNLSFD